jgi:hypothetical protein
VYDLVMAIIPFSATNNKPEMYHYLDHTSSLKHFSTFSSLKTFHGLARNFHLVNNDYSTIFRKEKFCKSKSPSIEGNRLLLFMSAMVLLVHEVLLFVC